MFKKISLGLLVVLLAASCSKTQDQNNKNELLNQPQAELLPVNYAYVDNATGHVIYNGKDLGDKVGSPVLDGDNIALISSKGNHIIYNGKDLGVGFTPILSQGHIVYVTQPNTPSHVIYDGKDVGSGYAPIFAGISFG